MKLTLSGHEQFPMPTRVPGKEVEQKCAGEQNGCFLWDGEWSNTAGVLTVKFKNRVLVKDNLTEAQRRDVLEHEKRHWEIFQRHALDLKAALERAMKDGRELDMANRWDWLKYDIFQGDALLHRQTGRFPIKICFAPTTPRPK
jgi:hypothetical protein